MAGIKRLLAKAGKGALSASLGIGGDKAVTVETVREILDDDEIAERLAQIVAAGLLLAAEGEDEPTDPPQ